MLAQATDGGGGATVFDFVQYGILGLVLVGLLLGWLWPKPSVDHLVQQVSDTEKRAERAEAQRDELLAAYRDQVLPMMGQFVETSTALRPLLTDVIRLLENDRTGGGRRG